MKHYIIPTESNNYSPVVTRSASILIFAFIVFAVNLGLSNFGIALGGSAINIDEIVALHNQEREAEGLSDLSINTLLNASAQAKAEAMLAADCWSHYCPEGTSPWDFFDQAGYVYVYAGENLAQGFYSNESVMQAWMNSPTHKENVLKQQYTEVGIGIAYGEFSGIKDNIVIAVHFGSRGESFSIANDNKPQTVTNNSNKPVITFPYEGAKLNDSNIEIRAESQSSDYLEIIQNEENKGRLISDGGVFTYRTPEPYKDGLYTVKVKGYKDQKLVGESSNRKFTIDTVGPDYIKNAFQVKGVVSGKSPKLILEFTASEPLSAAKLKESEDNTVFFTSISALIWEVYVDPDLTERNSLQIELVDQAGNESVRDVSMGSILGLSDALTEISYSSQDNELNSITALAEKFVGNNIKTQVNFVFIMFAGGILTIDFIALKKTGLTGFKGKSHLHLSTVGLLVIVILIGGTGGVILTGLSA